MKRIAKIVAALLVSVPVYSMVGCNSQAEQEPPVFYTVTFVQSGQQDIVIQVKGGTAILNIPQPVGKVGYDVLWESAAYGKINSDLTVTTVETAKTYTISYNFGELEGNNDATITSKTQPVTYDAEYSLYTPECYGYDFARWEKDGNEFTNGVWSYDGNVTLTAVWNSNHYKISFSDTQYGKTENYYKVVLPEEYKNPICVEIGDTLKGGLPEATPADDEYKLKKWVTYINGQEIEIKNNTVYDKNTFAGAEGMEIVLYPVLEIDWIGPY